MITGKWRRVGGAALLLLIAGSVVAPGAVYATPSSHPSGGLPLGPASLVETRTDEQLQPGVTLTRIVRGAVDPAHVWTVEINIPAGGTSPDPDAPPAALSDRADAEVLAGRVHAAGFEPRVEPVTAPPTADYVPGLLGWRVRVGRETTRAGADALLVRLVAAGFAGASRFTGWDGADTDRGPWRLQVLTIDPRRFTGRLVASYGPDLERRETTSTLSAAAMATAGVNAGYFVLDPASGAPGDPAGAGVYGGRLLSETVNTRPALLLREDARGTDVERLRWRGTISGRAGSLRLDGLNRVPGLIRNCGGLEDEPTTRPLHDFTCVDDGELVAFTPQYGSSTPTGPGVEAVLDATSRVVAMRSPRGGALSAGQRSVQATGDQVDDLRAVAVLRQRLQVTTRLLGRGDRVVRPTAATSIVNGGPVLVRNGRLRVTPQRDGFVRPTSPSFYYGFSAARNPRTFAGVDARGRTLLVTADGRSTASLGLSITETGAVAQTLGMVEGMNLDGGGSTTLVVGGRVANAPSDATGERPVGDALLVLPRR
ncbi:MAG TPA: phosphodiester glycosidase family protein [Microlunatus sp.]|nr:phosphodiester glycosidase family protein [Microlunatus sp.]